MNQIPQDLMDMVTRFFHGDSQKAWIWFVTSNPLLGLLKPTEMLHLGREEKLRAFIIGQLAENVLTPKADPPFRKIPIPHPSEPGRDE